MARQAGSGRDWMAHTPNKGPSNNCRLPQDTISGNVLGATMVARMSCA